MSLLRLTEPEGTRCGVYWQRGNYAVVFYIAPLSWLLGFEWLVRGGYVQIGPLLVAVVHVPTFKTRAAAVTYERRRRSTETGATEMISIHDDALGKLRLHSSNPDCYEIEVKCDDARAILAHVDAQDERIASLTVMLKAVTGIAERCQPAA